MTSSTEDEESPTDETIWSVHNAVYIEVWKEMLSRDDIPADEAKQNLIHLLYEDNELAGLSPIAEPELNDLGVFDEANVEYVPENAETVAPLVVDALLEQREERAFSFAEEYENEDWHWPQFVARLEEKGHEDLIPAEA